MLSNSKELFLIYKRISEQHKIYDYNVELSGTYGYIKLDRDRIVELCNTCSVGEKNNTVQPLVNFSSWNEMIDNRFFWHTHPGALSDASANDFEAFDEIMQYMKINAIRCNVAFMIISTKYKEITVYFVTNGIMTKKLYYILSNCLRTVNI
ncbi:MAG: hypothetical protein KDH96_07755 [Candidatus Riesia sp.]|nr:hypothetical protein [Candidatus Riesia sp.]